MNEITITVEQLGQGALILVVIVLGAWALSYIMESP